GQNYIIANPGEPPDADAIKDLQKKIAATTDMTKKADFEQQLALYKGVQQFEKPKREYNAFVLTASKRLSHNFIILASYTYSRNPGNYPGLFSYNNNQLDPNISSQYDLPELVVNRNGPLPNDRPHNLKLLGTYLIPITGNDSIGVGLNFNLLS